MASNCLKLVGTVLRWKGHYICLYFLFYCVYVFHRRKRIQNFIFLRSISQVYSLHYVYFLPTPVLTWLRLSHFFRLDSNSDIAWKINAEIVTKPVAVTIAELFSYIKHENANMRMRRYKSCLFFTNLLWYSWVLLIIFNILL